MALTFDDGPDPERDAEGPGSAGAGEATRDLLLRGPSRRSVSRISLPPFARGDTVWRTTPTRIRTASRFEDRADCGRRFERAQAAIEQSGGGRPTFFRAPGRHPESLIAVSCSPRAGLSLVSWTRRGFDTVTARRRARRGATRPRPARRRHPAAARRLSARDCGRPAGCPRRAAARARRDEPEGSAVGGAAHHSGSTGLQIALA